MKTTEVRVIQKPINIIIECPHCNNEQEYTYDDFCDIYGEPCDWNYSKIKCERCDENIEIYGSEW